MGRSRPLPELANVALAIGVIALLLGRIGLAKAMGLLGVALALTAPHFFEVHVADLRVAYFLWLLCMVVLFVATYIHGQSDRGSATDGTVAR